ncbi:uncharacterized protein LOC143230838 isoform X2 [Tachypleus tridentatus]|uniref:uncharacterized protein LOC143230838 isoform X2 n=1 Tax=Tachypleus tridentatus TaxID=6853 RepID=UPI003FD32969
MPCWKTRLKNEKEKCHFVNTVVKVKTEPSESTNDNIISKFSESDYETVDFSQSDVMSLKSEPKRSYNKLTVS